MNAVKSLVATISLFALFAGVVALHAYTDGWSTTGLAGVGIFGLAWWFIYDTFFDPNHPGGY